MALSEYPSTQQLKDLAAQYADLEVTRDDSLDAGNCESGTDDFLAEYFKGRTSIKVSIVERDGTAQESVLLENPASYALGSQLRKPHIGGVYISDYTEITIKERE